MDKTELYECFEHNNKCFRDSCSCFMSECTPRPYNGYFPIDSKLISKIRIGSQQIICEHNPKQKKCTVRFIVDHIDVSKSSISGVIVSINCDEHFSSECCKSYAKLHNQINPNGTMYPPEFFHKYLKPISVEVDDLDKRSNISTAREFARRVYAELKYPIPFRPACRLASTKCSGYWRSVIYYYHNKLVNDEKDKKILEQMCMTYEKEYLLGYECEDYQSTDSLGTQIYVGDVVCNHEKKVWNRIEKLGIFLASVSLVPDKPYIDTSDKKHSVASVKQCALKKEKKSKAIELKVIELKEEDIHYLHKIYRSCLEEFNNSLISSKTEILNKHAVVIRLRFPELNNLRFETLQYLDKEYFGIEGTHLRFQEDLFVNKSDQITTRRENYCVKDVGLLTMTVTHIK